MSKDEKRERFLEWLRVDTTTGREAEFLLLMERTLKGAGLWVERQRLSGEVVPVRDGVREEGGRWNVIARGQRDRVPKVVFCTHVDTVPDWFGPRVEEDRVFARGACDTKGVLAAMLEAYEGLDDTSAKDVGFVLVVGEEVDHIGAKVAEGLGWSADRVILGEPTRGEVAAAQKGVLKIRLDVEGKAGHSAFVESGVSALHRLLETLETMRHTPWPSDALAGETTFNVGLLEGGVAANVFAPHACATLLFRLARPVEEVMEIVESCIDRSHTTLTVLSSNDPQYFDPPEDAASCVVPFNSDAAWVRALGPVWLVGPGDIRVAHSVHEHIAWSDLERGVEQYRGLVMRVLHGA